MYMFWISSMLKLQIETDIGVFVLEKKNYIVISAIREVFFSEELTLPNKQRVYQGKTK